MLPDFFVSRSPSAPGSVGTDTVVVGDRTVRIRFVVHPRARRYRLIWHRDGTARCTVPPRGTVEAARRFVERCHGWLAERIARDAGAFRPGAVLPPGTPVWFRGGRVAVQPAPAMDHLDLGGVLLPVGHPVDPADLRPALVTALRRLATLELPPRVHDLAARHGLVVARVTVRNQRSRWGSCSRRGSISLNWRLVQTPDPVRDYILLHELAHLRHLDHSPRFWDEVTRLCPDYAEAEGWLRRHGREIL